MQYLNADSGGISSLENESSSWCVISIDKKEIKVKIKHIGGGKFTILSDGNRGEYTNRVVYASDILHC